MGLLSLKIADQGSMSEMAIFQQPFVPTCVGARKVPGSLTTLIKRCIRRVATRRWDQRHFAAVITETDAQQPLMVHLPQAQLRDAPHGGL